MSLLGCYENTYRNGIVYLMKMGDIYKIGITRVDAESRAKCIYSSLIGQELKNPLGRVIQDVEVIYTSQWFPYYRYLERSLHHRFSKFNIPSEEGYGTEWFRGLKPSDVKPLICGSEEWYRNFPCTYDFDDCHRPLCHRNPFGDITEYTWNTLGLVMSHITYRRGEVVTKQPVRVYYNPQGVQLLHGRRHVFRSGDGKSTGFYKMTGIHDKSVTFTTQPYDPSILLTRVTSSAGMTIKEDWSSGSLVITKKALRTL